MNVPALTKSRQGIWRTIAQSGVQSNHTGNTDETVLATVPIPAGTIGANGVLRVTILGRSTGTNTKTHRMRLGGIGGTVFFAGAMTTNLSGHCMIHVFNRNAQNSQVTFNGAWPAFAQNANAVLTGAVDTSAAQDLVLTGQLTNTGENISIEGYIVEVLYKA